MIEKTEIVAFEVINDVRVYHAYKCDILCSTDLKIIELLNGHFIQIYTDLYSLTDQENRIVG